MYLAYGGYNANLHLGVRDLVLPADVVDAEKNTRDKIIFMLSVDGSSFTAVLKCS